MAFSPDTALATRTADSDRGSLRLKRRDVLTSPPAPGQADVPELPLNDLCRKLRQPGFAAEANKVRLGANPLQGLLLARELLFAGAGSAACLETTSKANPLRDSTHLASENGAGLR